VELFAGYLTLLGFRDDEMPRPLIHVSYRLGGPDGAVG
jgi:hypothetical protein